MESAQSDSSQLFDIIETKDNNSYLGVIDYETTKHFVMFDVQQNQNSGIRMIIIIWKLYFTHIRFSIFRDIYFPQYKFGNPILINKKSITYMNNEYSNVAAKNQPLRKKRITT